MSSMTSLPNSSLSFSIHSAGGDVGSVLDVSGVIVYCQRTTLLPLRKRSAGRLIGKHHFKQI